MDRRDGSRESCRCPRGPQRAVRTPVHAVRHAGVDGETRGPVLSDGREAGVGPFCDLRRGAHVVRTTWCAASKGAVFRGYLHTVGRTILEAIRAVRISAKMLLTKELRLKDALP